MSVRSVVVNVTANVAPAVAGLNATAQSAGRLAAAEQTLGAQQARTQASMARTGTAATGMSTQLRAASGQTAAFGAGMGRAGGQVSAFAGGINPAVVGLAGLAYGLKSAVGSSVQFEQEFANVRKVMDETDQVMDGVASSIRRLSTEMPVTTTALNEIAAGAGRMGVGAEDIEGFTRTVAMMNVAIDDMDPEQIAMSFARIATITNTPIENISELGNVVVRLGNNFAAQESEISNFALRIAGAGTQIGMTNDQIFALSTALPAMGLRAEMGGSSVSRIMIDMAESVSQGGDKLNEFARVSNMSSEQFQAAWRDDAAGTFLAFLEGLQNVGAQGESTFAIIDELGLSNIRTRDTLLRGATASSEYARALGVASDEMGKLTALEEEYGTKSSTTQSQWQIFKNNIAEDMRDLGDSALGPGNVLLGFFNDVSHALRTMRDASPGGWLADSARLWSGQWTRSARAVASDMSEMTDRTIYLREQSERVGPAIADGSRELAAWARALGEASGREIDQGSALASLEDRYQRVAQAEQRRAQIEQNAAVDRAEARRRVLGLDSEADRVAARREADAQSRAASAEMREQRVLQAAIDRTTRLGDAEADAARARIVTSDRLAALGAHEQRREEVRDAQVSDLASRDAARMANRAVLLTEQLSGTDRFWRLQAEAQEQYQQRAETLATRDAQVWEGRINLQDVAANHAERVAARDASRMQAQADAHEAFVRLQADGLRDLIPSQRDAAAGFGDLSDSAAGMAATHLSGNILDYLRDMIVEANGANEALDDLHKTAIGLDEPLLDYMDAADKAADAQERLNEVNKDSDSTDRDRRRALMDVYEANREVAYSADALMNAMRRGEIPINEVVGHLSAMAEAGIGTAEQNREIVSTLIDLATEAESVAGTHEIIIDGRTADAEAAVATLESTLADLPTGLMMILDALPEPALNGILLVLERLGLIPPEVRARLEADDLASAVADEVERRAAELAGRTFEPTIAANDQASGVIGAIRSGLEYLSGRTFTFNVETRVTQRVQQIAARTFTGAGLPPRAQADGGVLEFYASGGMREDHVAQIAPAGSWRVWAEPETGGEAYIPLADTKRARSRDILEQVANRFGGTVDYYASGDVVGLGARLAAGVSGRSAKGLENDLARLERALAAFMRDVAKAATARQVDDMKQAVYDARADEAKARREVSKAKDTDDRKRAQEALKSATERTADAQDRYNGFLRDQAIETAKIEVAARQLALQEALRMAQNREALAFDRMSTGLQIRDLERRMAAETQFTDGWTALFRQRQQLLDSEHASVQSRYEQALADLNRNLDSQLEARRRHADRVVQLRQAAADAERQAEDRRTDQLRQQLSLDQGDDAWSWQAGTIAGEARRQASEVADYAARLAEARSRGVSDDALVALGIDGPEALGQLRVLLRETDDALADMSAAIAERNASVAAQVAREMGQAHTELGREVRDIRRQLDDDLKSAASELGDELATIGAQTGRGHIDAIVAAQASGMPALRAQAEEVKRLVRSMQAAQAAASRPVTAAPGAMSRPDQIRAIFDRHGVRYGRHADGSWEDGEQRIARLAASDRSLADLERSIRALPKYHGGGVPPVPAGVEFDATLVGGEGIFTRDQMRNLAPVSAVHTCSTPAAVVVDGPLTIEIEGQQFPAYLRQTADRRIGAHVTSQRRDLARRNNQRVGRR